MRIIVLGISWIIALLMFIYSGISLVTFNDVTVDIDLSVYGKSSAEAMVGKRKQMSTPQKTSCYIFARGFISVNLCLLSDFAQRKIFLSLRSSVFVGRPLRRSFSQLSR
jgi:hypothetical protein